MIILKPLMPPKDEDINRYLFILNGFKDIIDVQVL